MTAVLRLGDETPDGAVARFGAKGAGLAVMAGLGLPVPAGFVLGTDVWAHFTEHGTLPDDLEGILKAEVAALEATTGRIFGAGEPPLLLAVRAGAPVFMPGMLRTILYVGSSAAACEALGRAFSSPSVGVDVRLRALESYGTGVLGLPRAAFDALRQARTDGEKKPVPAAGRSGLAEDFVRLLNEEGSDGVPSDPWVQLTAAIRGVLASYASSHATDYIEAQNLDPAMGTAVVVQAMVYGEAGERSAAGVVGSRHPSTGAKGLYGEYLPGAPGDDVVGGRRTPLAATTAQIRRGQEDLSLETAMPEQVQALREHVAVLEEKFRDPQDLEFVIEEGALHLLQCRPASRGPKAAVRIAVELAEEGLLPREVALSRVDPAALRSLLTPQLADPEWLAAVGVRPLARGLAASPGAVTGPIALDEDGLAQPGAILIRPDTSAEDVGAMRKAAGILTAAGGLTSHAAVVARAMGKPCIVGATALHVARADAVVRVARAEGDVTLALGEVVTIDGTRGLVFRGEVPVKAVAASPQVETLLQWADAVRRGTIFVEAGDVRDAQVGVAFGADAIYVRPGAAGDLAAFVNAAGERPVWVAAASADGATAALPYLREGDGLVLEPPDAAIVAQARAAGVEVVGRSDFDRRVSSPPSELPMQRLLQARVAVDQEG